MIDWNKLLNFFIRFRSKISGVSNSMQPCHLLLEPKIDWSILSDSFGKFIKCYDDGPHFKRYIMRCKYCGQLYFHQFVEFIDWEDGNDPTYETWVPIKNEAEGDILDQRKYDDISDNFFSIHYNWGWGVIEKPKYAFLSYDPIGENKKYLTANCSALDIYNDSIL